MAAPNLRSPSVVTGRMACAVTTETDAELLANPAGSGKVLKINAFRLVGASGSTKVNVTVNRGGTAYALASAVDILGSSMLILLNKDEYLYLEEGDAVSLSHLVGYQAADVVVNYEEIS